MSAPSGFASRLFLSGSLAFVVIGVLGSAYGVSLPAFTRAFGLAPGQSSLILTAYSGGAVLVVAAGTMGLRGLTARLSAAFMVVGATLIAAMLSWPLTLAGAFVAGLGFGIVATHVNRSFLEGFGTGGPGMVGLVNAISAIGLIAAPLIYVGVGGSASVVFTGIAILAAGTFVLFRSGEDSFAGSARGLPDLGGGRLGIVGLNMVSTMMESSLAGLGKVALIATGWTDNLASLLLSGFFVAFLLARLSLYWISRVVSPDRMFLIGTAGTAACAGLAALGAQGIGFVLAGAFVGFAFPSFYVWGARILGPDPRMGSSMLLAGLIGSALGPLVCAAFLRIVGLPMLFATVAATGIALSAAIIYLTARPGPRAVAGA